MRSSPAALTKADINAFLLRECGRVSAGSAKGRVAELRSILPEDRDPQGITRLSRDSWNLRWRSPA